MSSSVGLVVHRGCYVVSIKHAFFIAVHAFQINSLKRIKTAVQSKKYQVSWHYYSENYVGDIA